MFDEEGLPLFLNGNGPTRSRIKGTHERGALYFYFYICTFILCTRGSSVVASLLCVLKIRNGAIPVRYIFHALCWVCKTVVGQSHNCHTQHINLTTGVCLSLCPICVVDLQRVTLGVCTPHTHTGANLPDAAEGHLSDVYARESYSSCKM